MKQGSIPPRMSRWKCKARGGAGRLGAGSGWVQWWTLGCRGGWGCMVIAEGGCRLEDLGEIDRPPSCEQAMGPVGRKGIRKAEAPR